MRRSIFIFVSIIVVFFAFSLVASWLLDLRFKGPPPYGTPKGITSRRVAHAGGMVRQRTYTNSIDALDANLKNGFRFFELDFSFTRDGKLVCLHDWNQSFERAFGFKIDEKVTLEEFEDLVYNRSEFDICTVYTLSIWMMMNRQAIIITDVKGNNIDALKIILETLPDAETRVIPQVYQPENIAAIKELGYRKIIWTLYNYPGTDDEVLSWVEELPPLFAVTLSRSRAESTLPKELKKKNTPTYVHTINSVEEAQRYMHHLGVTEIYTDVLPPGH